MMALNLTIQQGVIHAFNLIIQEAEQGGSLCDVEASFVYMTSQGYRGRSCLKKQNKQKRE